MRVGVVGLGKLGAPLAVLAASRGHKVIGLDKNERTLLSFRNGIVPIREPGVQDLFESLPKDALLVTGEPPMLSDCEMVLIIVPTPSGPDGRFANTFVQEAVWAVGDAWRRTQEWKTLVICSTVMPGSTSGEITEILEFGMRARAGEKFSVVYSPEFIALGSVLKDMQHPDMVLMGSDDPGGFEDYQRFVSTIVDPDTPIVRLSTVDAEIAKIAINTYLSVKVSYANNLANICSGIPGANADQVLAAVGMDSRIGSKFLKPGGPVAGPCLPRDTIAFSCMAKDANECAHLAHAADEINDYQIERIVRRLAGYKAVAILGMTYKPESDVTEMSLGTRLCESFVGMGTNTNIADPLLGLKPAQQAIDESEAVVIATPHQEYQSLDFQGKTVIDPWGLLK